MAVSDRLTGHITVTLTALALMGSVGIAARIRSLDGPRTAKDVVSLEASPEIVAQSPGAGPAPSITSPQIQPKRIRAGHKKKTGV
ncbi:MAG TPA: hypothetical protein VK934_10650 [Fimbriimonas sp.]|nr:hypothetical protein [Fimbriimonas sp.]